MKKVLTLGVVLTTIIWTMGLAAFIPVASAATLSAGDLIKASTASVYYYAADGKRYCFPTESTYKTWYTGFTGVKTITNDELGVISLGGNILVRPGTKLVKITTVPKVYAVKPNGKLVWVETEAIAKALYGDNWNKMIIDVPDSLWPNYTDSGLKLDATAYPEGQIVKKGADAYYVNADGSWSKVKDEASFTANKWSWDFAVTTTLAVPATAGAEVTAAVDKYVDVSQGGGAGTGTVAAGKLAVSLNTNTPKAQYVSKAAQNVLFAKYDFTATGGDATVTQIVLQRKGLGYDADLGTIRLYDGTTKIGTDQSLNTNTHKVTFKNLSWKVSGTKTLSVKANIASSPSGTNDYFELVEVTAGTATVSGAPVVANAMEFSALTVGSMAWDAVAGTTTIISGEKDKELACWNITTNSTEGFYIDGLKVTNIGTASTSEALNFYLRQSSNKIAGSDVAAMASNGTVTFDLTAAPYFIDKSQVKKICVWGDIAGGITVAKTLRFQIAEAADVTSRGESSAGEVLATYNGSNYTAFIAQSAKTNNISQGTATIAQNAAYAPTSGSSLVKGVANNKLAAYKLTAGSNEGVKLTKLKVTMAGTGIANTDFSNWSLYKIVNGAEVAIPVSGSVSSTTVTFEDTTDGLIDVAKSQSETVIVRADVSTSFAGTESGVHIYIGTAQATGNDTIVKIKGVASNEYVTNGVTTSGVATGDAQTFEGAAYGTLVVSKASASPAADTVAKGTTKVHLTDVNLYATGENMTVTELVLTAASTGTVANDISNAYITDKDGKQIGTTVASPSSGEFSFSFSLDVAKDTNVVIKAYADIPAGATSAAVLHLDMDTAGTDITTAGVASGANITETGTCTGSNFTVGGPTITAAMATSPLATSYVIGATGITVGKLILTAGATEDVKITSIKISSDDAAGITGASVASAEFANLKLLKSADHNVQYGVTQNFTDGVLGEDYANFTGIDTLSITKGQSVNIDVVLDIAANSGNLTYYFGVENPTTQITGVGLTSNASLAAADINAGVTTAIASTGATLAASGNLTVSKAADMPAAQQLVSGSTANEIAKYKLSATTENIDITAMTLTLSNVAVASDFANVKLYVDGKILGDPLGYTFSAVDKAITFASGTFVVNKDQNVYLTLKADMNPKAQVTSSVSLRYLGIKSAAYGLDQSGTYTMTAKGVSSQVAITSINDAADDTYTSNAFTINKGVLQVALATGSPSGTATSGAGKELLKFTLTAVGDDITVNDIEFVTGGTCTVAGTGIAYLKSNDGQTTYAEWTAAAGLNGAAPQDFNFSVDETNTAWNTVLSVTAGETKTLKFTGDTTGCTTNGTLQISIEAPAAGNGTAFGMEWADSSTTNIGSGATEPVTKGLPLNGGGLVY